MLGTASAGKHDLVRRLGATPIDYRNEDFVARTRQEVPGGVDVVYDAIGGANLAPSKAALRRGGTLVAFGLTGNLDAGLADTIRSLMRLVGHKLLLDGKRLRTYAILVSPGCGAAACRDDWARLVELHTSGAIEPQIGLRLPLADAAQAHAALEAAEVTGKVVLLCA